MAAAVVSLVFGEKGESSCSYICEAAVSVCADNGHWDRGNLLALVQLFLSADMRFGGIGIFLVSTRRMGS